jgi:hypothetical protein
VKEAEYGGNVTYSCMKMQKWDLLTLFQEWGKEIKENVQQLYSVRTFVNVPLV